MTTTKEMKLEKTELEIGFLPILCAAPLILAHASGIFERHGLHVNLKAASGWSGIKELMAYGKIDAAHMLSPMPLACNLGIDGKKSEIVLAAIQNINGQALTLSKKHLGIGGVSGMRGFTFGVPYRFSMHYYLLCHYLAEHGVDPLREVTIIEVAPPNMPYYLAQGWVDGVFAPEPFNQIPVTQGTGFIHVLSRDIWKGHPCCGFATSRDFMEANPNTYTALLRSIIEAESELHHASSEERCVMARAISDPAHLNLDDPGPAEQVLGGVFPDGKGGLHQVADRIDFVPHPFAEYGYWMLSQMQRWGQVGGRVDYGAIVERTFDSHGASEVASATGYPRDARPATDVIGFDGKDPFAYMGAQPFCSFTEEEVGEGEVRDIPGALMGRLSEINDGLASAVGGQSDVSFEVTGDDELGRLEELLRELVLNTTFTKLLLSDRNEKLRQAKEAAETERVRLLAILDGIDDVIYVSDPESYELLHVNAAFKNVWGDDVIGKSCYRVLQGRESPCPFCTNDKIFGEYFGKSYVWEFQNEATKGWFRCSDKAIPWVDGRMVRFELASDISLIKTTEASLARSKHELETRNRIAQVFLTVSNERMYDEILALVLETMESEYGVFGYIDEEGALVVPTMSRHIWEECQVVEKTIVYPEDTWGDSIWPRALREKKTLYSNDLSAKTPQGHIPISRNIALPLINQGKVVGLIQVANKKTDYTDRDIELLEIIGNTVAPILEARLRGDWEERERRQAEEALRKHHEHLEELVEERTEELNTANVQLKTEVSERRRVSEQLQQENWIKTGIAELRDAVSGDRGVEELASSAVSALARYISAQVGAVYAPLSLDETAFSLVGRFAWSPKEGRPAAFEPGDGLVGQAALEKKQILVENVPEDYLKVASGLGNRTPRHICVMPFLYEDRVKGVVELGAFDPFTDQQRSYLNQAMPHVAMAVESAHARDARAAFLAKTQEQAEELQTQQEELQAANEELQGQARRLSDSREKLKEQQEELQVTIEELEEKNDLLQRQKLELEDARQEVESKADELAQASRYKSEFLANMSHELRSPLNSLLLLSQALAKNRAGNLAEDDIEAAKIIYSSGSNLLSLIDEILDLSKIEAGRMELQCGTVRLKDLADSVRASFGHMAEGKGLRLEVTVSEGAPAVIVSDRKRVEQVLRNLTANAIKFTETGTVTVTFGRPAPGVDLSGCGLAPGSCLAVVVKDTGIGIAPDKQAVVFDAFQQADGGTARKYGGTGLGLSISRDLAQLLGGEIRLESEEGKGATFVFYLPLDRGEGVTAADGGTDAGVQASRLVTLGPEFESARIDDDRETLAEGERAVLVIEDDPGFGRVLYGKSHEKGFRCLLASTGEEGLDLAGRYLPVAVILDIRLPGMDGWAVLSALKEDIRTRHIPVHIVSGLDEPSDACRKGALGYLTKPLNEEGFDLIFEKLEKVSAAKPWRVLIVEDNPEQRLSTAELIGDSDVITEEAENGAQALEALRTKAYDCVILDLGLPDMGGTELLATAVREGLELPPIVVHTARALTPEEEMELHNHAESIVIKDVRSQERLLDEVSLFLHRVVNQMPEKTRRIISELHDTDQCLQDKKVLVVDDDMRTTFVMSRLLHDRGMVVIKAENGGRALELLEEQPNVDIVLMDVMMPVMDGYEAMKRIREQERFRTLPIIALTAKAMPDDREKCFNAGASDYLPKPVDEGRLISLMRVWLYR